jgi:hypothetical protein
MVRGGFLDGLEERDALEQILGRAVRCREESEVPGRRGLPVAEEVVGLFGLRVADHLAVVFGQHLVDLLDQVVAGKPEVGVAVLVGEDFEILAVMLGLLGSIEALALVRCTWFSMLSAIEAPGFCPSRTREGALDVAAGCPTVPP